MLGSLVSEGILMRDENTRTLHYPAGDEPFIEASHGSIPGLTVMIQLNPGTKFGWCPRTGTPYTVTAVEQEPDGRWAVDLIPVHYG